MGITDKAMQAKPESKDKWLTQPFMRGGGVFVGRITPAGERLFYFRYTDSRGGRPFLPIGPYHSKGENGLTLAQAYDKAAELSALYRTGIKDLREHFAQVEADRQQAEALERQRQTDEQREREAAARLAALAEARRLTVRQVFENWRTADLQPRVRADGKRTGRVDGGKYVLDQFTRHVFPVIGERAVEDVTKADLLALLDVQKAAGKMTTARRLLADLKQMLDFALERDLIVGNPLATVKKNKVGGPEVERDRNLSDQELRLLVPALAAARMQPRAIVAVWLTLATAVRVGELMGAVWADDLPADPKLRETRLAALQVLATTEGVKLGWVDVSAQTWHLPTTKNQRDHTIHLSAFALSQIEALRQHREVLKGSDSGELSPWLFPATDNARPVCVKSFAKQVADRQRPAESRLSNRSKATTALALPGGKWKPHDLRRTAATHMAKLGFDKDTVNECLNHKQADRMARVYIHDRREADQARAFEAWGAKLAAITAGEVAPTNVVTLRPAQSVEPTDPAASFRVAGPLTT